MLKPTNQIDDSPTINFKTNGKEIAATIAPRETYWERIKTTKNSKIQIPAAKGVNPIITPREVATPFPPLNFRVTGKTWPMTAAHASANAPA